MKRPLLFPLVPFYAAGLAAKDLLRDRGILPQRALPHPVFSVGSLSAGGAGKTPVVLALADLLTRHSLDVRILSRGYGRASRAIAQVDPTGTAATFGDEPLLLAQSLAKSPQPPHVRVFVGADRHAAGLFAEQQANASRPPATDPTPAVYLLDDGFQHRQLTRTLDLVLLTQHDLADTLLPAGNLREPLAALRRAHVLLVREEEASLIHTIRHHLSTENPPQTWLIRRTLAFPNSKIPTRPLAFSAIARPANFLAMLAANGIEPVANQQYPDHHPYTAADIDHLFRLATKHRANGFLTTEKDLVKLTPPLRQLLETIGQIVAPRLKVELLDQPAALKTLLTAAKLSPLA